MATTISTFPPSFADALAAGAAALSEVGTVRWWFSGRVDGDLSEEAAPALSKAGERLGVPVYTVHQTHGAAVQVLGEDDLVPGGVEVSAVAADGLVTALDATALAVRTADCAPVLLWSPEGVIGAAHGGWGGLERGVVGAVADAMRAEGATSIEARLGPCIGPECYEFGQADLDRLAERFGSEVRAEDSGGRPALDLRAAVAAAAGEAGVALAGPVPSCTACGGGHYSYRARGDRARQASMIWRER
ncbi:MAG: polyphenol oxidase family protein [Microthrixaceae bacterium]